MKLIGICLTSLILSINIGTMGAQDDSSAMKDNSGKYILLDMNQLMSVKDSMTGSYLRFLDVTTMSMGIYSLAAGETDNQNPHNWDEVYVVMEGKAHCEVEGDTFPVKKGDLIFVRAHADHRFSRIEEDLKLLVFFSKKE